MKADQGLAHAKKLHPVQGGQAFPQVIFGVGLQGNQGLQPLFFEIAEQTWEIKAPPPRRKVCVPVAVVVMQVELTEPGGKGG